ELGADIYLFSTYKTYGPHQGIMVIRRELGEKLPNQGHHFNAGALYKRFTPAGPDHAQVAACAGIVDYFEALYDRHFKDSTVPLFDKGKAVHKLLRSREEALMQPLLDYIKDKNSLRLLGPGVAEERAPTLSVTTQIPPQDISERLAARQIAVGGDNFYGQRPIEAMGLDAQVGVLRMSFVHYTSENDIARLIQALDDIL
ncbi:MAG: aminotransferase class V-fold PLP-dependent enzyme, partial [Rhodobacteraceae bacterium]|nr:aminotransferase class V-fold PLP-dependent enzyme [Paracoccaceae bacterium]